MIPFLYTKKPKLIAFTCPTFYAKTCTFVASIFSWSARGYVFSGSKKKSKKKAAHVCFGFSEEKHEWDLAEVVNNWCLSTSAGTSMQCLEGRLAELSGGACTSPHWTHPSNLFTYFLLIKIIRSGPRFLRGERIELLIHPD